MSLGLAYGGLPVTLNTVIDAPFKPLNQNYMVNIIIIISEYTVIRYNQQAK